MSIQVFHQSFHVNSAVLKVHSGYFSTFLDSPDKSAAVSSSSARIFKYEWVTEVDHDGSGWILTAREKSSPEAQAKPFKGNETEQIHAFQMILQALHCQPITITTAEQLCRVTQLSDFYRVLPAMSNALHGVFFGNSALVESIPKNCVTLLEASYMLRNKLLFRECFIHIMGPMNKPRYLELPDGDLKRLCISTRQNFQGQLNELQMEVLKLEVRDPYGFACKLQNVKNLMNSSFLAGQTVLQPSYYRAVFNNALPATSTTGVKVLTLLKEILQSKLVLDKSGIKAGEGIYKDSFLCFELTDQQLPWDVNQSSW